MAGNRFLPVCAMHGRKCRSLWRRIWDIAITRTTSIRITLAIGRRWRTKGKNCAPDVGPSGNRTAPGPNLYSPLAMESLPIAALAGLTASGVDIAFYDDRMEAIDFDRPADLVAIPVETYTARRAYQIASEFR